jgi:UDP-4-amino-4,6-dideoxy-N-acetyl-beta-L-altrosamine N-acetyltransferase
MLDHCNIRELTEEDLPKVLNWRNHPKVRSFMLTQHEISFEEHRHWFYKVTQEKKHHLFIVEQVGQSIGFVQFNRSTAEGVADWGFYASPNAPRGTGIKLGITALDHAFANLKLNKIVGRAFENNKASISMHLRLGFNLEDKLIKHTNNNGVCVTLHCFGLHSNEWQIQRTKESI